jgi:hypothetical protein
MIFCLFSVIIAVRNDNQAKDSVTCYSNKHSMHPLISKSQTRGLYDYSNPNMHNYEAVFIKSQVFVIKYLLYNVFIKLKNGASGQIRTDTKCG